jgi:hypothetical protein
LEDDGLTPNNLLRDVLKTNDAFDNIIEEALTGSFGELASQNKRAFPENFNDFTSPFSPLEAIPASVPVAVISPPRTDRVSINALPLFIP